MIKENQRALNSVNVLLDALILFVAMPVAFYIRFYILHNGVITVPLSDYMTFLAFLIPSHLITFAIMGLYESLRKRPLTWELARVFWGCVGNVSASACCFAISGSRALTRSMCCWWETAIWRCDIPRWSTGRRSTAI